MKASVNRAGGDVVLRAEFGLGSRLAMVEVLSFDGGQVGAGEFAFSGVDRCFRGLARLARGCRVAAVRCLTPAPDSNYSATA